MNESTKSGQFAEVSFVKKKIGHSGQRLPAYLGCTSSVDPELPLAQSVDGNSGRQ